MLYWLILIMKWVEWVYDFEIWFIVCFIIRSLITIMVEDGNVLWDQTLDASSPTPRAPSYTSSWRRSSSSSSKGPLLDPLIYFYFHFFLWKKKALCVVIIQNVWKFFLFNNNNNCNNNDNSVTTSPVPNLRQPLKMLMRQVQGSVFIDHNQGK